MIKITKTTTKKSKIFIHFVVLSMIALEDAVFWHNLFKKIIDSIQSNGPKKNYSIQYSTKSIIRTKIMLKIYLQIITFTFKFTLYEIWNLK